MNGKNVDTKKEKNKFCCQHKLIWENALINSIGKGPLAPVKPLLTPRCMPMILLSIYSKFDQATDLWKQLEMATGLESHQRDTMDLGRNWIVDLSARKTHFVSFDRSNSGLDRSVMLL